MGWIRDAVLGRDGNNLKVCTVFPPCYNQPKQPPKITSSELWHFRILVCFALFDV